MRAKMWSSGLESLEAASPPYIDVPLEYLEASDVDLLSKGEEIIGGFVYGSGPTYRYVERMEDPELREHYAALFSRHRVAELTILWLKREYRKTIYSTMLWAHVGLRSFLGDADSGDPVEGFLIQS